MSATKDYLSVTDTAKLLRAALKAEWPGVRFSVRSHSYAGGASVDIEWTDGPTSQDVDGTAKLYQGSTFDGMTDMKTYHDTVLVSAAGELRNVHFGADHVFTRRNVSEGFVARCAEGVTPTGRDSTSSQCRGCGCWQPARDDLWVARYTLRERTELDFCCSQQCAAERVARFTPAEPAKAL